MTDLERSIQVLANIAIIATLAVTIFAYIHTVIPVFQKERLAEESARLQAKNDELQAAYDRTLDAFVDVAVQTQAFQLFQQATREALPFHLTQAFTDDTYTDTTFELVAAVLRPRLLDPIELLERASEYVSQNPAINKVVQKDRLDAAIGSLLDRRKTLLSQSHYPAFDVEAFATRFVRDVKSAKQACSTYIDRQNLHRREKQYCDAGLIARLRSAYALTWSNMQMNAEIAIWDSGSVDADQLSEAWRSLDPSKIVFYLDSYTDEAIVEAIGVGKQRDVQAR